LVNNILDEIPQEYWSDPNKRWLEPACGDGNFLVEVHRRLMVGLEQWQPNAEERHRHIIETMIFGIDLMEDNAQQCIARLNAAGLKHHIVCADALTYHYRFDEWEAKEDQLLFVWTQR
jgi:hypothetical protein